MKISNPVPDLSNDLLSGNGVESTADRRKSVTSDPIGSSTGKNGRDFAGIIGTGSRTAEEPLPVPIDVAVAVEKLNQIMQSQQTNVSFSVDEDANATVIRVFKTETGELIKQFPPEQILAMKERVIESIGLLYDNKV
jgi:flagellar protein FlaG